MTATTPHAMPARRRRFGQRWLAAAAAATAAAIAFPVGVVVGSGDAEGAVTATTSSETSGAPVSSTDEYEYVGGSSVVTPAPRPGYDYIGGASVVTPAD